MLEHTTGTLNHVLELLFCWFRDMVLLGPLGLGPWTYLPIWSVSLKCDIV